ncbi:hypothetical protein HPB48_013282 [Haemaphysalis longicornis]|uniref:Uncharacterized protein n=1 Tax=Haemaphysalis longicornis TaxID=44386 RepID=A0A9J6GV74_HAELO|nr:hypothetical protein HPB48_013282 [Haemaphysalis longicornis]
MKVLGLGLNSNCTPESDVRKIVCVAENAVSRVVVAQQDEARTRIVNALSTLHPHASTPALTSEKRKAGKSIYKNADIAILHADKVKVTVLLDTTAYIEKIESLIKDRCTYARMDKDPTAKVQQQLQKLLADVFIQFTRSIGVLIIDYCATTDMPRPCTVCQKSTSLEFPCVPSSTLRVHHFTSSPATFTSCLLR